MDRTKHCRRTGFRVRPDMCDVAKKKVGFLYYPCAKPTSELGSTQAVVKADKHTHMTRVKAPVDSAFDTKMVLSSYAV